MGSLACETVRDMMKLVPLALLALTSPSLAAPQRGVPSAEELMTAWSRLDEADRKDTVDWFIAECDRAQDFRANLERFVMEQVGGPRVELPAAEDPPTFDPELHCPGQPIARRFVSTKSGKHKKVVEEMLSGLERPMRPAVVYDWARQELVRVAPFDDPERIAHNAAHGFTPYTDLVEAWVVKSLDGGEMADQAKAFGHAYADRSGNAYREITLFEAWGSGRDMEMPDVECLGIVHRLDDDWKTYVAPVNARLHRRLYGQIGDHYVPYKAYRDMREAIARTYVTYEPTLPTGYATTRDKLHGFWERAASDPEALGQTLPKPSKWREWFAKEGRAVDQDDELRGRTRGRMAALRKSGQWARRTFHGILVEYGAFEEPDKAPGQAKEGGGGL